MNRPRVPRIHDGQSERHSSLVMCRPTSWLFALWSAYIAAWAAASAANPALAVGWWLAGVVLLQATVGRRTRPDAAHSRPATGADQPPAARGLHLGEALQDWESEGGAIA